MNTSAKAKQKKTLQSTYASHGADKMLDREILELILSYAAPGCRAKIESQKMLQSFGSFENIFKSDEKQFCKLTGLGESAAVLFSLINNCPRRVIANKNISTTHINSADDAKVYFSNMLYEETVEKIALMCLDRENRILTCCVVSEGTVNSSEVSLLNALSLMSDMETKTAILAHNHPRGKALPSAKDLKFTVKARNLFGEMGVRLIDHIIVGEGETISLNSIDRYKKYFLTQTEIEHNMV